MNHERLPLQAAQYRAQLLSATQILAIVVLTIVLVIMAAHVFAFHGSRVWAVLSVIPVGALALLALHAYLVRCSRTAFRWSLAALACLAAAQIVILRSHDPATISGTFSVASFMAMVLSVQASRPRVRAGIIDAIDKDVEARMARARALGSPTPLARNASAQDEFARV